MQAPRRGRWRLRSMLARYPDPPAPPPARGTRAMLRFVHGHPLGYQLVEHLLSPGTIDHPDPAEARSGVNALDPRPCCKRRDLGRGD